MEGACASTVASGVADGVGSAAAIDVINSGDGGASLKDERVDATANASVGDADVTIVVADVAGGGGGGGGDGGVTGEDGGGGGGGRGALAVSAVRELDVSDGFVCVAWETAAWEHTLPSDHASIQAQNCTKGQRDVRARCAVCVVATVGVWRRRRCQVVP
jgi:hypothetical protein